MSVEENITISAVGGDDAADQINKATKALDNTAASSGRLQVQFQERFQHIGLKLFAEDALRASGLGGEARMIISTINLALNETATAAGLSSGGLMLIVAAVGALIAILVKLHEKFGEHLDMINKTVDADDKHLKSINDSISGLEKYGAAVGHLNKVQSDYLQALKDIGAEEAKKKNDDLIDQINALNAAIQKEKDKITDLEDAYKAAQARGIYAFDGISKEVATHNNKILELTADLKKAEVEMNALHSTGTNTFQGMSKDAEEHTKLLQHQSHEAFLSWQKDIDDTAKANEKALKEENAATKKELDKQAAYVKKITDEVGMDFGNAFAKSLVEGKKFTDEMKSAFTNMAEQIISMIIQMITEWLVFSAMSGMGGGMGGVGAAGLSKMGFATGGDVIVDKPTLFMAGEAGPERATFAPLSGSSARGSMDDGGDGGGGVTIGSMPMTITVSGVNDPKKVANEVGLEIIKMIRGAGQLSFVR